MPTYAPTPTTTLNDYPNYTGLFNYGIYTPSLNNIMFNNVQFNNFFNQDYSMKDKGDLDMHKIMDVLMWNKLNVNNKNFLCHLLIYNALFFNQNKFINIDKRYNIFAYLVELTQYGYNSYMKDKSLLNKKRETDNFISLVMYAYNNNFIDEYDVSTIITKLIPNSMYMYYVYYTNDKNVNRTNLNQNVTCSESESYHSCTQNDKTYIIIIIILSILSIISIAYIIYNKFKNGSITYSKQ